MKTVDVITHITNWLKYYSNQSRTNGFVVGISGGVDSAITSTLCALTGKEVLCLLMPIHQHQNEFNRSREHAKWLKKNGNNFIYINGANDTWSATRVIPTKNVNALYYNMAGKHHGNARIKNLTDTQKEELKKTLEEWLEVEVDMTTLD